MTLVLAVLLGSTARAAAFGVLGRSGALPVQRNRIVGRCPVHSQVHLYTRSAMALKASAGGQETTGKGETEHLFVYGSLMSHQVLSALLHRVPQIQPGVLRGFHRFRIRERPYPAIARVPGDFSAGPGKAIGGEVEGLLLCGLSEEEHALLDYFEDEEYAKEEVVVQVSRQPHVVSAQGFLPQQVDVLKGETAHAWAYVFAQQTDALYGEWNIDKFLESDILPGYVAMSSDCRNEYLAANPST
jgi:gamma-glutamylcyclotransferase (GGCT)/AIG2-like uncharacterized protein YtfP